METQAHLQKATAPLSSSSGNGLLDKNIHVLGHGGIRIPRDPRAVLFKELGQDAGQQVRWDSLFSVLLVIVVVVVIVVVILIIVINLYFFPIEIHAFVFLSRVGRGCSLFAFALVDGGRFCFGGSGCAGFVDFVLGASRATARGSAGGRGLFGWHY